MDFFLWSRAAVMQLIEAIVGVFQPDLAAAVREDRDAAGNAFQYLIEVVAAGFQHELPADIVIDIVIGREKALGLRVQRHVVGAYADPNVSSVSAEHAKTLAEHPLLPD